MSRFITLRVLLANQKTLLSTHWKQVFVPLQTRKMCLIKKLHCPIVDRLVGSLRSNTFIVSFANMYNVSFQTCTCVFAHICNVSLQTCICVFAYRYMHLCKHAHYVFTDLLMCLCTHVQCVFSNANFASLLAGTLCSTECAPCGLQSRLHRAVWAHFEQLGELISKYLVSRVDYIELFELGQYK